MSSNEEEVEEGGQMSSVRDYDYDKEEEEVQLKLELFQRKLPLELGELVVNS